MSAPIRIANIAGLYGDRFTAPMEMLEGGDVDVLTGDWLAELTMVILARTRGRRPDGGYGRTFVAQMEQVLGTCVDRGVKVVVNAGGLDPLGCAAAVSDVADQLGLAAAVAAVTGDDLIERIDELAAAGEAFAHLDSGEPLGERRDRLLTANAYLGCWGIVEALSRGADVVITGRVADASVVVGPAAWHHGWRRDAWDELAGATVAGHVLECGCQTTGGNYSFFQEIDDLELPGFPWAEIANDGSAVIGKHQGTGGEVSVGTVTSQLLYEIAGPAYLTPDVIARFDTVTLAEVGDDRVHIGGVRGEPPSDMLKVAAAFPGGFRNSVLIGLTGLDVEEKAELVQRQFWRVCPWDPGDYEEVRATVVGSAGTEPSTNAAAVSLLEIAVRDSDESKVGRRWADSFVQIALASIPGLFGVWPPGPARPYAVYWPTTISRRHVTQRVHFDDEVVEVEEVAAPQATDHVDVAAPDLPDSPTGPTFRTPLGRVVGARSGDKGGNANLGVFVRRPDAYEWMSEYLTVEQLRVLLPDLTGYPIERHELPNLLAINFVIRGLLDEGVGSTLRFDPQAKGLGEYLRAKTADIPEALLG